MSLTTNPIPSLTNSEEQQLLQRLATGEINAFWQLFQQHRDYLFRCCLKWMNGNSTDAEDLLSQAMLKALKKAQKYAEKIANFKSWLTTLTRNFWIDLTRRPCANQVEDIEVYAGQEDLGLVSVNDTPASALEHDEKKMVIGGAIDKLTTRLRETFILHFYAELSHQEIAEKLGISYQNVCKRISQARAILVKQLREYFVGGGKTEVSQDLRTNNVSPSFGSLGKQYFDYDQYKSQTLATPLQCVSPVSVTPGVTESAIEEMSQGNGGVEASADEMVTLSVAVAEVESFGGEQPQKVVLPEQHSESDSVAATAEENLEVRSDGCRCVEVVLCEWQPAPILALAQFEEETGCWGNSCVPLLWRRQWEPVGQVAGELVLARSSRSPPWYCLPLIVFDVEVCNLLGN